jgi:ribosomal protein L37AE/L43A
MAQQARCPSCGAPVDFKSAASILAVCDYCQSTLLRQGEELDNLGKMAALIEDRSPLQRGAEGRWRGRRFGLIGRIQLTYEQGLWNEWHLLFDDGKTGWLSEAGGEYVVTESLPLGSTPPPFKDLVLGESLRLNGSPYTITNLLAAECVAGEGELPFKVGAGYPAPVADLRDEQGRFATLDYSDVGERPLFFAGESVAFASLGWANLRQGMPLPQVTVKARAFNCPSCAAPLKITHENIETLGCHSCGALLDTGRDEVKLIKRAAGKLKLPRLPPGSRGTLRGQAVEIIGYMRRCMSADGKEYCWGEYVCLGKDNALVWLTEYDGHWSLAHPLKQSVAGNASQATIGKDRFKHFQSYTARVDVVLGEFPWRVRADERAKLADYIAPPRLLSRETTDKEVSWTLAEYIEPAEIEAAFSLKQPLPKPQGVYANQPNLLEERHRLVCKRFWRFALVALVIHLVLMVVMPGGMQIKQSLVFTPDDDEPQLSQEFRLHAETPRLEVASETNLNNNWIGLGMTLVNKDTGENWQAMREISRYEGVDGGESWSEGSRSDSVVFRDLLPGVYLLMIEPDMDAASPPVTLTLNVERAGSRWSSLLLVLLLLVAFPIYTRIRMFSFEVKRWAESDHPIVTEGEDDD